ncbi:MAG TPA: hypothetical protein VM243_08920 [Phycisphaerae bacterium]|nr:hypothetical protein [Phycisphaerae bacterium]
MAEQPDRHADQGPIAVAEALKRAVYFHSGSLFRLACRAYEQTKTAAGDRDSPADGAIVAVVFAAASLEAFVNEVPSCADLFKPLFDQAGVAGLGKTLHLAESEHASPRLKFQLLKVILSGKPYDEGTQPYQDFGDLLALRDSIIHMKPTLAGKPGATRRLEAKNILSLQPPGKCSWLHRVNTRAVARWACQVAANMVRSIGDESPLPRALYEHWGRAFPFVD